MNIVNTLRKSFIGLFWILVVLLITVSGCSRFDLDDFKPGQMGTITDSLKLKAYSDTSKVLPRIRAYSSTKKQLDSLIFFAEWVKNSHENEAMIYAQKAYDIATEKNWNVPRIISANRLAWLKAKNARYEEVVEDAMVDAKICRRLLEEENNDYWDFETNYLTGYLLDLRSGAKDSARRYFELALEQIRGLKEDERIIKWNEAMILHNLAKNYSLRDSLIRVRYYSQSDSLFELINNQENRAWLWKDWGNFYRFHKEYQKADSLFSLCITIGNKYNDENLLALSFQNRGLAYLQRFLTPQRPKEFFTKGLSALKQSLKYKNDNDYRTYELIGNTFQASRVIKPGVNQIDSAFLNYKIAIEKAGSQGVFSKMAGLGESMNRLYRRENYKYKETYQEMLEDKSLETFLLENFKNAAEIIDNRSKSAYQRINVVEQRDIEVKAANKNRNQLLISLTIFFLAIMFFLYALQRQQTKRLQAEMEALRAQMNPHFISNSLNAIESLVNFGNTEAASKYLIHFSRLSRQILSASRETMTTLKEELSTLEHFLVLEQLRFRDKLTYKINVGEGVNPEKAIVPAMILQPYVENAIWHGIKPKPEGGYVNVSVFREGKIMICSVEDNGIGREKSRELQAASILKRKSVGMKITEDRLRAMNKLRGSQVEIYDIQDESGNASGTKITIKLLYREKMLKNS